MKNTFKRILVMLLAFTMIFTSIPIFVSSAETTVKVGDIVEFGLYPQSEVTDSSLKSKLTSLAGATNYWTSYGYYSGSGLFSDGKMTAKDYMKYKDVTYNGQKYRGVYFTEYRPCYTGDTSSYTYQDYNGYFTSTQYWFRFDPIKWRVLDPSTGLVMSETILDSQACNNYLLYSGSECYGDASKTYYANNWEHSSIRKWLNNDFLNTAFSSEEQNNIKTASLSTPAYSTSYSKYDSEDTLDKVFLLSYTDVQNTAYGFASVTSSSDTRTAQGSSYAKCQGLFVSSGNGNSWWRLRSGGRYSNDSCNVYSYGSVSYGDCGVSDTGSGVRPALLLQSLNPASDKQIAVYCTEKSLSVQTGNDMWLGFGIYDKSSNSFDGEWKKMSVVASDPTVISLSGYNSVSYGDKIHGYTLKITGKKAGTSNLTITDTESGLNTIVTINVYDKYIRTYSYDIQDVPKFYPNNKWENHLETNIYNLNKMYVCDYSCICETNRSNYKVSFTVYNENYYSGAVDIYDADGIWVGSEYIDKYSDISSLADTGKQSYYLISDWVTGRLLTYKQAASSKETKLSFEVPQGGYFTISNNMAQSPGTFFANALEVVFNSVSTLISAANTKDMDPTAFNKFFKDCSKSFAQNIIDVRNESLSTEVRKKLMENALDEMTDKIEDIQKGFLNASTTDIVSKGGKMVTSLGDFAKNILEAYDVSWSGLYSTAKQYNQVTTDFRPEYCILFGTIHNGIFPCATTKLKDNVRNYEHKQALCL